MFKCLLTAALALLLLASPAAGRNFKTTLDLDPPQPRVGELSAVYGCGYKPGAWTRIYFLWQSPGEDWQGYSVAWYNGGSDCIRQEWTPTAAALHRVYVYQQLHRNLQLQHYIEFDVMGT